MALVNVIPCGVQPYGRGARLAQDPARVEVRDGSGAIGCWPPSHRSPGSRAPRAWRWPMNGDNVLDLLVGTGPGVALRSWHYSGADGGQGLFRTELARFNPLDTGSGRNQRGRSRSRRQRPCRQHHRRRGSRDRQPGHGVLSSTLPTPAPRPEVFSTFTPYPGSRSGVTLASGTVDVGTGRPASWPHRAPENRRIRTFRYDLYSPTEAARGPGGTTTTQAGSGDDRRVRRQPNRPTPAGCRAVDRLGRQRRALPRA